MKVALDTNILVYAENFQAKDKHAKAIDLLTYLRPADVCIPVQVLGELHRVLISKAGMDAQDARDRVVNWSDAFMVAETNWAAFSAAMELSVTHKLPTWDALIISVAAQQGCRILYTEDMQEGFFWSGVTLVNPFTSQDEKPAAVKKLFPPELL